MNDYPPPAQLDREIPVPQAPPREALQFRELLTAQMQRIDEYLLLRQAQVQNANTARSVTARTSMLASIAHTDRRLLELARTGRA